MKPQDQVLEVWGELACFTRPELKVERFSYPVITPSAARGIYDAIYCKPSRDGKSSEFRWQITKVEVLSKPEYIALRRNEVKNKAPPVQTIERWMTGQEKPKPIFADGDSDELGTDKEGRTQRQTMALRNPRYRLHAEIRPWPGLEDKLPAFEAQFRRRAAAGKCFYQPYFGCREFPAYFRLIEDGSQTELPDLDIDIGVMLYDVFDLSRPGSATDPPFISVFRAKVTGGVMEIPDFHDDSLVLKPPRSTENA